MRHPAKLRSLRPFGILLLALGTLGMAIGSSIKQGLHIASPKGNNSVDFFIGLAMGMGVVLLIGSFIKPEASAEAVE